MPRSSLIAFWQSLLTRRGPPDLDNVATRAVRSFEHRLGVQIQGSATSLKYLGQFFMILMYDLAARDGEMLALNLADIDTRRLTADLLGKGSKPRRLPITSETARHFDRYVAVFHPRAEPEAPMFYTCEVIVRHGCLMTTSPGSSASTPLPRKPDAPTSRLGPILTCCATFAMRLLHAGVDTTVIALWLGHEGVETTQMHADLTLKERALARTTPIGAAPGRYRPPDELLAFLEAL
jgi:integrase/recombinase XerD